MKLVALKRRGGVALRVCDVDRMCPIDKRLVVISDVLLPILKQIRRCQQTHLQGTKGSNSFNRLGRDHKLHA